MKCKLTSLGFSHVKNRFHIPPFYPIGLSIQRKFCQTLANKGTIAPTIKDPEAFPLSRVILQLVLSLFSEES
jgi:hypothetical protein